VVVGVYMNSASSGKDDYDLDKMANGVFWGSRSGDESIGVTREVTPRVSQMKVPRQE